MGKLKAPVPAPCKRSRMKGFHFKTDSSPLVRVLNGSRFPIEGLKSQHTWEEIEEFFKKEGESVGTEVVHGASTGTSKIPNLDENVSAAFVKLTLEEMKEVAATVPQDEIARNANARKRRRTNASIRRMEKIREKQMTEVKMLKQALVDIYGEFIDAALFTRWD